MANLNQSKGGPRRKPLREKKEFQEELLSVDRVTRVTAWGRQLRFRASIVIGDGKGRVSFGTGKSGEVVGAIQKAINNAKKDLVNVQICEWETVSHEIKTKFKSAVIMLHPASQGTGIIAGGAIRKVLHVAWYKNVLAKRYGSTNLINNARATIKALTSMKK